MQPGPVRQRRVHVGARIVQTSSGERGESLGQAADRRLVSEADVGPNQPPALVDPDAVRPIDQHIRHPGQVEEGLQRAGTGELGLRLTDQTEDLSVAGQPAGVLADQGSQRRAAWRRTGVDQLAPHPIEDVGVHAAIPIAAGTRRIASQSAASLVFRNRAVGSPVWTRDTHGHLVGQLAGERQVQPARDLLAGQSARNSPDDDARCRRRPPERLHDPAASDHRSQLGRYDEE